MSTLAARDAGETSGFPLGAVMLTVLATSAATALAPRAQRPRVAAPVAEKPAD